MNTLDMVMAAVASSNKVKADLNKKHEKHLDNFKKNNLEEEYQMCVNRAYQREKQIGQLLSSPKFL